MTAEPTGHVMWSSGPIRQRLDVLSPPDDVLCAELREAP